MHKSFIPNDPRGNPFGVAKVLRYLVPSECWHTKYGTRDWRKTRGERKTRGARKTLILKNPRCALRICLRAQYFCMCLFWCEVGHLFDRGVINQVLNVVEDNNGYEGRYLHFNRLGFRKWSLATNSATKMLPKIPERMSLIMVKWAEKERANYPSRCLNPNSACFFEELARRLCIRWRY